MLFNKKNQVITALVTPFLNNYEVDYDSLTSLIEHQIKQGIDALLLLGTTAESATLNEAEKNTVIKHALEVINDRVPVILGVGSNCTKTTIGDHKKAKSLGVYALSLIHI